MKFRFAFIFIALILIGSAAAFYFRQEPEVPKAPLVIPTIDLPAPAIKEGDDQDQVPIPPVAVIDPDKSNQMSLETTGQPNIQPDPPLDPQPDPPSDPPSDPQLPSIPQKTLSLKSLVSAGPQKDGIPSIDQPRFVSVDIADGYLRDEGWGIAVSLGGVERFYPYQILVWHELVNDQIGDQAILVTYCPLGGTGIVFEPALNGQTFTFGTSGKLWNSNLVMYDRQTGSYWSQVLGEAIQGEEVGKKLALLPHDAMRWQDWKIAHPQGEVLSKETGFLRNYQRDPYDNYPTERQILFPVDYQDNRYHPKEVVFGLALEAHFKAYPLAELAKNSSAAFTDSLGNIPLEIQFNAADQTITILRLDTDERVIPISSFWFLWSAVHPETEVYVH